jgi:hypothetical protein
MISKEPILYILDKSQKIDSIKQYKHQNRERGHGYSRLETLQPYPNPQYKGCVLRHDPRNTLLTLLKPLLDNNNNYQKAVEDGEPPQHDYTIKEHVG